MTVRVIVRLDITIGLIGLRTLRASISPSLALIFFRHVDFASAIAFTLVSNLSSCLHLDSICFFMSLSFSANRASASLHRLSKSNWIWLRALSRVIRLSWKTLKFVNGLVSA